jgi:hypothetical protein
MAVATYSTDLQTINLVTLASGTTNWTALGGGAAGLVAETDFYIQGDACLSKSGWSAALRGMIYNNVTGITLGSQSAVFMWVYMWAPTAISTEATGGLRIIIGNSTTAYTHYYVRGSDTYQYSGWICVPVDPRLPGETQSGTPTGVYSYFGALANITGAVTKGQPLGIDSFRHGRTLIVTQGDPVNGYGNFGSASITNDLLANRWGLFQSIDGGYLMQGSFQMGSTSSSVFFVDSNRNISIANTKKVERGFNEFRVLNTGSTVSWSNITVNTLGTFSRGNFYITDDASVTLNACTFADMGEFSFRSKSLIQDTTFRRCQTVIQGTASFDGCLFDSTISSTSLLSNNPGLVQNSTFIRGTTGHGIEITRTGTYSFIGNIFEGYGTASGTEALFNNSGGFVALNLSGGTNPTIRNGTGASTSVISSVTITVTGLKDATEVRVYENNTTNELAGIEEAIDGTTDNRSFAFSLAVGIVVDIAVISIIYENERIENYTVPGSNSSIPVQQRIDRNYKT